jgi:AcrR family transcriptional regulator
MTTESPSETRKRSRRKEARPAEIATAALRLFAERGFAATRLEDVAAAAGIGKGTIYLYFANKEELFEAVVLQRLVPRLDAAEAIVGSYTGPAAGLLRAVAGLAADAIGSDIAAIPKLVVTESGNFPDMARFYADNVVRRGKALIGRVLALGEAQGEFRPVDIDAVLPVIVGPILMMVLWQHSLGRHTDLQFQPARVIATHLDMLLRALAPGDSV